MDILAAPLLSLLQADHAASAVEGALMTCPDLPEWAPPQKSCPKATLSRPVNDLYEFWQGISW